MNQNNELRPNTLFIEVSKSGLPEVDGLFVPSTAPPVKSESGTESSAGYWNGKMAWDRADGKSARSPSISYSNTYRSWRISRLDGHLAYDMVCEEELPPIEEPWHVYKKGVAPAPEIVIHYCDPRLPCPPATIVFVLGGPGTGKGTMCELAELQLGWTHLSTGVLLRDEIEAGGPNAQVIEQSLADGQLVANEIVLKLLQQAIENTIRTTGKTNFLLDGFPRSLGNLDGWYDLFGRETELPKMLYLDCPYEVLEKRIMGRSKYTGRNDDNLESMKLRFDTFREETLPTVELFRSKDKCIEIDTSLDRGSVYKKFAEQLSEYTDESLVGQPLSERAEMLLGIRPFPKLGN
ncbi:MAG: AAA family ATPase [Planctomycetaceae bacterium]|nr:AAA family ATPase [Planctomycetaceae bacterium]MCP4774554.1 AAA family ATPase [Planctomycetaceae bacterium]